MGSEEVLAEALRLDRAGDHAGVHSLFQNRAIDAPAALFALYRLLIGGQFRSSYVAAKALAGGGSVNPVIDLSLGVGGALFGDAVDESTATERLAQTTGRLAPAQLKAFEDAVVAPAFALAMAQEVVGRNLELAARLHRIRKAASPGFAIPDEPAPEKPSVVTVDPVDAALRPFWRSTEMIETLIFIRANPHAPPQARLLFRPDRFVRLTSATRDTLFEPGRDYLVDLPTGVLTLPTGSRIPFKTMRQLAPYATYKLPFPLDDPRDFQFQQVEAHYTHAPGQWAGYVPALAEIQLPRTLKILRAAQPLKILISGDSIAEGAGTSRAMRCPPDLPRFDEQVARALERHYGAAVTLDNASHGGWSSGTGAKQATQEHLGARQPDLVIVAFGMNDITFANSADRNFFSPANYGKNIATIIDAIRAEAPEAEFILVSSMFGNAESDLFPAEQFPIYRDELARLVGPGIALADITALMGDMLATKSFFDMTFNGVNHPNDFTQRLYAQTILGLLAPPPAPKRVPAVAKKKAASKPPAKPVKRSKPAARPAKRR
jgi:lysophospholipase L1-like esterase